MCLRHDMPVRRAGGDMNTHMTPIERLVGNRKLQSRAGFRDPKLTLEWLKNADVSPPVPEFVNNVQQRQGAAGLLREPERVVVSPHTAGREVDRTQDVPERQLLAAVRRCQRG